MLFHESCLVDVFRQIWCFGNGRKKKTEVGDDVNAASSGAADVL